MRVQVSLVILVGLLTIGIKELACIISRIFQWGMLIVFMEIKIKVTHYVTRILGYLLQNSMHCVVKVQILLFGGRYTTPTMYVWPLRWSLVNTHSICSSTALSSWSSVHEFFSAINRDTPPPLPMALVNPSCLNPLIPKVSNENGVSHVSEKPITEKQRLTLLI